MQKNCLLFLVLTLSITFGLSGYSSTATTEQIPLGANASAEQIEEQAQTIPERPLDETTMALLLEAEFAIYRNNLERALTIYEQLTADTEDPGVAKRSAELAMSTSDPFRALDAALYYLDLAPNDDYAIELAARALARSAEIEGTWALLSEHPDKTYELRMATAEAIRLAQQMEDNYQIEWLLENILQTYGTDFQDSEIQLTLGLIYESRGNYEQAATYLEKANAANPDNILALRLHAKSLLRAERNAEAATLLSDWILTHTDDTEARISLAQMLTSFDHEAALPILEMLCAEYPWASQLLMATAQVHLVTDTPEKAIPYYQKLTQVGTFRAIAFFNLARIYERQNELQLAADYYGKVDASDIAEEDLDMLLEAKLRLALLTYELGGDGHLLFEQLRTEHPEQSVPLFLEEAGALIDIGEIAAAIVVISEGLAAHPSDEALLYSRSLAYEQSKEVDAAVADLRAILALDNNNPTALNALGYTLANHTDQYEEAYALIDRALSLNPEDPAIIDSMGWVLYHMGHYQQALKYLRLAHENLLDEEVIAHLAEVLWKLDQADEAREILEQGLVDLPDSDLILTTRSRLGLDS